MSTLTSSSTFAEITAAYDDNASYEEDESASKCAAFITACRFLLRRMADESQKGNNNRLRFAKNLDAIRGEMDDARQWLSVNSDTAATGGVKHLDFSDFRD